MRRPRLREMPISFEMHFTMKQVKFLSSLFAKKFLESIDECLKKLYNM
jgi:hypothetical protein